MKITLAAHYGLCFGVRDALRQAEDLAQSGPLTVLGELVHNPVVRERLAQRKIGEGALDDLRSAASNRVMITAHGASNAARMNWRKAGFELADGTCPLVHRAHEELAGLVQAGCFPVVIGKRDHVEVQGLIGDFPGAHVIEYRNEIRDLPAHARYGIISQTTQPIEKVREIVEAIRKAQPDSEICFRDTVCQPTKNRQQALRALISKVDTMVVVGGRGSNNTLQLAAAASNAGLRVFHIERAEELRVEWFTDAHEVGVTAGTSTLKETVREVFEWLCRLADSRNEEMAR